MEATGSRVLVVDDDDVIRELVRFGLEEAGHEVVLAGDGEDALDLVRRRPCDLVVTDVQMPRMDGFGLVRELRAHPGTRTVPIVMMTALSSPDHAVRGLRLGADDYVRKPFDLSELVARVQTRLERPPLHVQDLAQARRVGVLTSESLVREVERELHRSERSRRPFGVAVLFFAEQATIVSRFGRQAGVDVLGQAAQVAQEAAAPLDLAGLLPAGHSGGRGGLALLMPETTSADVEKRLSTVTRAVATTPFTVREENVHVTPVIGWVFSADIPAGSGSDVPLQRARLAAEGAAARLDLLPQRWVPELAQVSRPLGAPSLLSRLRTPAQIAATVLIGVVVPFLVYVGLFQVGVDISAVVYVVTVISLLVTAALIWLEGALALSPLPPPPASQGPCPRASAIIAAYLPNEAATVVDTVRSFLAMEYPGELQIILAYNTPSPMPVEELLADIARRDHRFVPFRVDHSTSKAQNVNAALAVVEGAFTGVFDADHHPEPGSFTRAWRWLGSGYDVVQGRCVVRNGKASWVARTVAVEFEAIYAVSHPGRARLHGFGIFGGSNGYWRTAALREARMRGQMLTEDIDSSMRALLSGWRIANDPGLVSRELAPTGVRSLWHQRMRWAQGWAQVSRRYLIGGFLSPVLTPRNKLGLLFLLGWREVYPWIALQIIPLVAFFAWRDGGIADLRWVIPMFVLTTLFTLSVGPGQVYFAYRLGVPELRARRRWYLAYLLIASLAYTEFKNLIARVAHIKELTGERRWVVTPRSSAAAYGRPAHEYTEDEFTT